MANFKCKMCGAPLEVKEGQTIAVCSYCGSRQTVANANDERKENLFNRANTMRRNCEFDKAILSYQSILSIFPDEPEAHRGLCLSKYGIEYVDDPATKAKKPTIHRVSFDSILKDSDYLAALAYADVIAREEYQTEAKEIADIQKNILSISQKEEPFDIFICYKETDEKGKRTPDSVMAQEIYSQLTDKGYKVFFSRVTLESKLGTMYEPYIFAALNSAKIMLVIGTKKEYFEAVWVKNEWTRFIDLMQTRPDHYLIPCYRNMDAYEMPEQFLSFQAQDLAKLGFMQDLIRGIDKIMGRESPTAKVETKIIQTDVNVSALLKRAEILIGDANYEKADGLLERVLDNNPTNSQAYLLKLLIELKLRSINDLKNQDDTLDRFSNFKKAYDFADDAQRKKINSINEYINNRNEENRLSRLYDIAIDLKNNKQYSEAEKAFSNIVGFRDTNKQAAECVNLEREDIYKRALMHKENKEYDEAIESFQKLNHFKDSEEQITNCEKLRKTSLYNKAVSLKEQGEFDEAINIFKQILSYNDSDFQVDECAKLKAKKKKKLKKISIISSITSLVLIGTLLLTFLFLIPSGRQSDIQSLINSGKYEEAMTLIEENGSFGDAENLKNMCNAGKAFESLDYETGIDYIYKIGGSVDVNYDNNGGTSLKDNETIKRLNSYIDNDADKNGYGFGGWVLTGYTLDAKKHSASIDLKAQYNATTYNISYNLNGGSSSYLPNKYNTEQSISIPNPTKNGYTFLGWTSLDLTTPTIDYILPIGSTGNKKYTANWTANTYSITYELNGGTNNSSNPTTYTMESNTITLKDATRNGYNFSGWYKTSIFSNKVTTIDTGSYGDLTLYAKWTPISYSINYYLNGGTNSSSNPSFYTVEDTVTFAAPSKTGYAFLGWFNGDNKVTGIPSGSTGSVNVEARWSANLHALSVTSEDTSKGTVAITTGTGYSDESVTVVVTPIGDSVFKGWYHESKKVSDDAIYTFVMPTIDYSLVARFFTKAELEEKKYATKPFVSADGKTITYGLYPQTNVNDSSLISTLNALSATESNGWYLYDNEYYAKVEAKQNNTNLFFDNGTNIVKGQTYWFKCEPIVWNVLSNSSGEYYIVSSVLLDTYCYHNSTSTRTIYGQTVYSNNYKYSDIRTWLNNDFYKSAFSLGASHIQTTTVDNSSATTDYPSNMFACANTQDKVFLPSCQDYLNNSYGFSTRDTRYCKTTDWARARGADYFTSSSKQYNGCYWTRSPDSGDSRKACYVTDDGRLNERNIVNNRGRSVRPALSIKIE